MTPITPPKLDVIIERLSTLQDGQRDIGTNVSTLSCNFQNFQVAYTKSHEQLVATSENNMKRLDKVEKEITEIADIIPIVTNNSEDIRKHEAQIEEVNKKLIELADAIKPLIFVNRIFVWLCIAVGSSVVALIWGIITHKIAVTIP